MTDSVVIVAAKRTPIGAFQGVLAGATAPQLGATAAAAAIAASGLQPADIQEVIMGCVLPAGLGQAPARQAAIARFNEPDSSRFVFLQGHPEYDGATLGREYLRDLERFHGGETPEPPAVPENYFDRATENRLAEAGADLARAGEIVSQALPLQSWRLHTGRLFANWLTLVAAAKSRRATSLGVHTRKWASS